MVGRAAAVSAEGLEAHDNAERVIRALAIEVAERGYKDTTVANILARGKMSATTLYSVFAGKEEVMRAAIDSAGAQMGAAMTTAVRRSPDWSSSVRAAIGALFNFLASRPALARVMLEEAYVAGPAALQRRVGYLEPLERLIKEGPADSAEAEPITAELIAGASTPWEGGQSVPAAPERCPGWRRSAPIWHWHHTWGPSRSAPDGESGDGGRGVWSG